MPVQGLVLSMVSGIHWGSSTVFPADKGGITVQWGKDSVFNKLRWVNWTVTCKGIKLEYYPTL